MSRPITRPLPASDIKADVRAGPKRWRKLPGRISELRPGAINKKWTFDEPRLNQPPAMTLPSGVTSQQFILKSATYISIKSA